MKKTIVSALTVALTVGPFLTACGSQGGTAATSSSDASANQPVNLTFDWWGSTVRDQMTKQTISDFEKKYPNIKVTPEFDGNFTDYFQKLSTQVSGGNAPDVIQMDYGYIKSYADHGALLDLSGQKIDLSNIAPTVVDAGKIDGKLYGIPNALNAYTIVYDPAMFEKAGITLSARPTWDEWAKDLNQIHQKLGVYGMDDSAVLEYFVRQNGQSFYSKDGKSLGFTKDMMVKFFTYWSDLRKSGAVPPGDVTVAHSNDMSKSLMVAGKAAATMVWSNQLVALQKLSNKPLKMMLPPSLAGGQEGLYIKASQYWSVYSKTKHPKEAALLVDFLLNDLQGGKDIGTERGIPPVSTIRDSLKSSQDDLGKAEFDYLDLATKNSRTIDPPPPTASARVGDLLKTVNQEVQYNKKTPEQAADEFFAQANQILQSQ